MSGWGDAPKKTTNWGDEPVLTPADSEASLPAPESDEVDELTDKVDSLNTKQTNNLAPDTEHSVKVTLADGSDAIYQSVTTFEDLNLHEDLLKGVYGMGYQKPSKIQANALPLLLANPPKNMIGQSQAGTGKTADACQAICLAPSRELARQILDNVRDMGKYTKVTTCLTVPGAVAKGQKVTSHVVVGTPGTVADLIKRRQLDVSKCVVFVLDEADSMLDQQGSGDTSIRIRAAMPKGTCQIVLFSATFPDHVREFAARIAPDANNISLKQEELSVDSIKQFYMDCKNAEDKITTLCALYGILTIGQSIIFVRTRKTADEVAKAMTEEGHAVTHLHGQFEAQDRDKAIDDFREGRSKVLITTNVIARGIDILQVNLVVNYDIPVDRDMQPDPETYIHRIGRTGRFGRQGGNYKSSN
ncbi:P-loop containing nucleoside triphosphate hydrolase protein [Globomyces pollinis-pini]|nr:P-loop containing nucleoside triphosphate hydrolase protein [Globomyces pollinis-pini]